MFLLSDVSLAGESFREAAALYYRHGQMGHEPPSALSGNHRHGVGDETELEIDPKARVK